jgi:hypothetical protein
MKKIIFLTAFFYGTYCQAQSVPPPRYSFALAYDDARGKLVMFGGSNRGQFMNDTWEWDGVKWEMKNQQGPSPRNSPSMVYDSKRKTIILFGGDAGDWNNKKSFGDTWEWNGSIWKLLSTDGPSARTNHTLAYDKGRDKVILFGGMDAQKTMGDLWEWDGTKWKEIIATGGPAARFLYASAYDEKNKKVLIFGGNTLVGPPTNETIKGDLWAWDGMKWEQCKGDGPSPRDHVDMVYDPSKKKVNIHGGGMADGNSASDTWAWDGKLWSMRVESSNAPSEGYKLVYDLKNETVLLFGGFVGGAPSSSLWKLNGSEWRLIK